MQATKRMSNDIVIGVVVSSTGDTHHKSPGGGSNVVVPVEPAKVSAVVQNLTRPRQWQRPTSRLGCSEGAGAAPRSLMARGFRWRFTSRPASRDCRTWPARVASGEETMQRAL